MSNFGLELFSMKKIPLISEKYPNLFAFVDDDDFESLSKHKWIPAKRGDSFYAISSSKTIGLLHRIVLKAPKGVLVDHIDGDTLNNTKENLRFCNKSQNMMNRGKPKNNTCGFKGVTRRVGSKKGKFRAQITVNYVHHVLGDFETAEKAHEAYCKASSRLHGEFSRSE